LQIASSKRINITHENVVLNTYHGIQTCQKLIKILESKRNHKESPIKIIWRNVKAKLLEETISTSLLRKSMNSLANMEESMPIHTQLRI
jgi:hypothetical protein